MCCHTKVVRMPQCEILLTDRGSDCILNFSDRLLNVLHSAGNDCIGLCIASNWPSWSVIRAQSAFDRPPAWSIPQLPSPSRRAPCTAPAFLLASRGSRVHSLLHASTCALHPVVFLSAKKPHSPLSAPRAMSAMMTDHFEDDDHTDHAGAAAVSSSHGAQYVTCGDTITADAGCLMSVRTRGRARCR
jgi:hypothetical protein